MSDQDKDARQSVPCVFFRKGSCRNGASCPFLHDLTTPTSNPAARAKVSAPRNIVVELKPGEKHSYQRCKFGQTTNVLQA